MSQVLHEYTKELVARGSTSKNLERHHSIVRQLLKHMGDLEIQTITNRKSVEYIRNREGMGVKGSTASRELTVLHAALMFCRKVELIDWNPVQFENIKSGVRDRYLSREEIAALLESSNSYHLSLWLNIALSTAARSGAILGLHKDRVRMDDNIIDFRDPTIKGRQKPRPVIPMPTKLRPHLADAINRSRSGYLVEKNGKPLISIYPDFMKAAERAGLSADVTPHIMRHTCAVHMVKNGVEIYEVSKYLAHTSIEITQKHYAKFDPKFMEKSSKVGSSLIESPKFSVVQG
jgi:integrase